MCVPVPARTGPAGRNHGIGSQKPPSPNLRLRRERAGEPYPPHGLPGTLLDKVEWDCGWFPRRPVSMSAHGIRRPTTARMHARSQRGFPSTPQGPPSTQEAMGSSVYPAGMNVGRLSHENALPTTFFRIGALRLAHRRFPLVHSAVEDETRKGDSPARIAITLFRHEDNAPLPRKSVRQAWAVFQ